MTTFTPSLPHSNIPQFKEYDEKIAMTQRQLDEASSSSESHVCSIKPLIDSTKVRSNYIFPPFEPPCYIAVQASENICKRRCIAIEDNDEFLQSTISNQIPQYPPSAMLLKPSFFSLFRTREWLCRTHSTSSSSSTLNMMLMDDDTDSLSDNEEIPFFVYSNMKEDCSLESTTSCAVDSHRRPSDLPPK